MVMQLWFYCIYISATTSQIKVTRIMINYFEFQLPDPPHDHDQFQQLEPLHHTEYLPHLDMHPLNASDFILHLDLHDPIHTPIHLEFAETLESEARPLLPPQPDQENSAASSLEKQPEAKEQRVKNETKNIPKNFGKGIITFIEKNERKIRALLRQERVTYSCFIAMMRQEKKSINTICDLRRLWTHEVYGKCLRIISNLFFRKHALDYIFNSRISNYASHIKYRQSLWKAIENPLEFSRIKEF